MTGIRIRPLTPDLWPALEDLFGPNGACGGCWCMFWRIGSAYRMQGSAKNKRDFRRIVKRGPPPGLLAFDGELAVGWCHLTPREGLHRLDRSKALVRIDDVPVWSLSCFYIRRGHRRKGVMSALIAGAIKFAKRAKAPALEAYPVDTAVAKKGQAGLYTGIASTFKRHGFKTVALRQPYRPVMRHNLKDVR